MSLAVAVATVHLVATLMMAGLIWFVQVVHYPLLVRPGADRFAERAHEHARRTSLVVVPLMLLEALGALLLVPLRWGGPDARIALAGALLLAAIWASTAILQVPCHRRLARGDDPRAGRRLVRTNWLRTALWTARVPVALLLAPA